MKLQDTPRAERKGSRRWRLVALLALGVAIGTTIVATPASANIGGVFHLWNEHIKPLTDARYYTKGQVNAYSSAQSAHRSSGPSAASAGPGFTTVVTQSVRPGFYVFLAKTVIITDSSTGSDCVLTYDVGGGEVEVDRSNQAPFNSSVTARTTHNLQRLLQFGSQPATIRLKCRAGTQWSATNSSIIAMRVASAVDSEVIG